MFGDCTANGNLKYIQNKNETFALIYFTVEECERKCSYSALLESNVNTDSYIKKFRHLE